MYLLSLFSLDEYSHLHGGDEQIYVTFNEQYLRNIRAYVLVTKLKMECVYEKSTRS